MALIRRGLDALRSAFTGKAGLLRVVALVAFVVVFTAAVPNAAEACGISDPLSCVAMIFVKIFQLLTALMGWILVLVVEALIRVAQFFNFVSPGPAAVQLGWVVTRDLANMFFIVMLLIIAFGTILGSSTYHYSKTLPRLLIMAVVINFSKTICGIFIDMGQVVMLTFVNGFKETAAGNFMNAYQINKLLALGNTSGSYDFGMVIAMMFAFILATIAVCVTLVLLVIVLFRVVMLWILIILSPLAFLASTIPSAEQYYKDWWRDFKKYIVTGPIIAFFMWLALASVQQAGPGGFASQGFPASYAGAGEAAAAARISGGGTVPESKIPTEAGTADTIMNMVIAICIMFAGLKYASDSGVAGSGIAKSVRGGLERTGRAIAVGGLTYAAKRASEPILTAGGKGLARVPLIGGLGRAAALQGEKWKKERQAGRERLFGGQEDFARLSPGAFTRSVGGLATKASMGKLDGMDKKRLGNMLDIGLKDPKLASSLGASGIGAQAIDSLVKNSSGKGLQDAVGTMMTDKNVSGWAKKDPDLLKNAYSKLKGEAYQLDAQGNPVKGADNKPVVKDPNMLKTLGDFEQKFVANLAQNGEFGDQTAIDEKLKTMAPKISNDDVMGLDKAGMGLVAQHLTGNQLKNVLQNGTPDQASWTKEGLSRAPGGLSKALEEKNVAVGDVPADWYADDKVAELVLKRTKDPASRAALSDSKKTALGGYADRKLDAALQSGDNIKVSAAAVDAITIGSLTADKINGDPKLHSMMATGRMDMGSLARGVDREDPNRVQAAQAAMSFVMAADPEKAKKYSKNDQYQHIKPTQEQTERASGVDVEADVAAQVQAADAQKKAAQELTRAAEETAKAAQAAAESAERNTGIEEGLAELGRTIEKRGVKDARNNPPGGGGKV